MPGEWSGTAEAYAESFGRLCAGSVDAVLDAVGAPEPGGRLIDVGTGPGTLARAAAARGWNVTAVDPEPSMVEHARSAAAGAEVLAGGLPELAFSDGSFDAVAANFVVNHTHDPRAATAELVRVCALGGTLAVTIWPRMRTVLNGLWSGIVRDAGAISPPGIVLPPEVDFERSEPGLVELLASASGRDASAQTLEWTFTIAPAELWLAVEAGVASIGTTYLAQDERIRAAMATAYRERTAELAEDGILRFPTTALLGTARG